MSNGDGSSRSCGDSVQMTGLPTGCTDWSAYDVVRHLYDSNATAGAGPGDFTLDITGDFDPRISPASG